MQLREVELVANEHTVETVQRPLEVPATREEITIQRTPVDRRPSDQPIEDRDQSDSVPVHEEQLDL